MASYRGIYMIRMFFLGLLVAFGSSSFAFEIHGHRGARSIFPENSLSGFQYAIDAGADFIEIDVHLSSDNEIIIHHDLSVNEDNCLIPDDVYEKYGGDFSIRKMHSTDLQRIDCGIANPDFPMQRPIQGSYIPTMKQLFSMIHQMPIQNASRVRINLEFKTKWWESSKYIRKMVSEAVVTLNDYNFRERTMIQSFDKETVRYAKEIAPDIRNHYLSISGSSKLVSSLSDWGLNGISIRASRVSKKLVNKYHAAGLIVIPWTSNDPDEWGDLIRAGVDGIITDNPLGLASYIGRFFPQIPIDMYANNRDD